MELNRRSLLNGTLFSGFAALSPDGQGRSSSQDYSRDDAIIARAINELTTTVQHAAVTSL